MDNLESFIPTFDDESNEGETNNDKNNTNASKIDIPDFERYSFYEIINQPETPRKAYDKLLEDYLSQRKDSKSKMETYYKKDLERYEEQIKQFENLIKEERENLIRYEKEVASTSSEKIELKKRIEELEQELQKKMDFMNEKDETIIQDRIKQVKSELNELINTLDNISKTKYAINEQVFEQNKEGLKEEANFFKKLVTEYETTLDKTKETVTSYTKKGVNIIIANFLLFTGLSVTGIAGWFFSIFSVKYSKLNSDSWLYFILDALYSFGEKIKQQMPLSEGFKILFFILLVLIFLFIVLGLGWSCNELIKKVIKGDKNKQNLTIKAEIEGNIKYTQNIQSSSFLGMWLQLMPYIFIVSIIYIIIQSGISPEDLTELDISLSGQVAGSTMALMIGGLGFIYIINVIIPRFYQNSEKANQNAKPSNLLKKNIELILLVVLFITTFIVMYLNKQKGTIELIGFLSCSLVGGFLIGIALHYKGLIQTQNTIKKKIAHLQHRIKMNSVPIPLFHTLAENQQFSQKLLLLENELLDLLIIKTRHIKSRWPAFLNNFIPNFKKKLLKLASWSYYNKRQDKYLMDIEESQPIDSFKKLQFPKEVNFIENQEVKIRSKKIELKNIEIKLDDLQNENLEYQKDKKTRLKKLTEQIDKCRKKYTDRMKNFRKNLDNYNEKTLNQKMKLAYGYDLALWFIKHGDNSKTQ